MTKNWLICLFFLTAINAFAQVTFIVNEFPENTPDVSSIYISGDFEGWSGGREEFKLIKLNQKYSLTIPKFKDVLNFKFTLGSWDTVETDKEGNSIQNRSYIFKKPTDTVYVSVSNWAFSSTQSKSKQSTASKNVFIFSENFDIPQLNRTRKISVYLPPNYDISRKKYPVLYMLDGQNVFDNATSYSGEWEVDEQLNKLFKQESLSLIVVAIDHGNEKRLNEYSAWDSSKYGKGEGKEFLDFIIETLKPEIDKQYRTKSNSNNTAIMGSSMGGLFSHYAAIKRPDVFGKAAVFSPSFWYATTCFKFTEEHVGKTKKSKFYYLAGDKEDETMVGNLDKMTRLMLNNKVPSKNLKTTVIANGVHNEILWKTEFEKAIIWLFNQ